MPAGYITGRHCKVYIVTGGSTYTHLPLAKNPKLGLEWDEATVEDGASIYKRYLKGLLDAPLEFEINRKIGDAQYKALRDAALDPDEIVTIAIASGDVEDVGEEVFEAGFHVFQFPFDMPLSDTSTVSVQLKLAANATAAPDLYDVTV